MAGVYLAVSARVLLNHESLNMAESVGNVVKHRKAPVTIQTEEGSYIVVYVPVISGMSLAHHYQVLLARAAAKAGLPVPKISLEGYFLKYANDDIINRYYSEISDKIKPSDPCNNERVIVEYDVTADVGGFLYTPKSQSRSRGSRSSEEQQSPVKRTSRFSFSYMTPTLDAIRAVGLHPQLHTRYSPLAAEREQQIFYVDNSSALYTFTYILEASEVSRLGVCRAMNQEPDDLGVDERVKRVRAAIEALVAMLGNMAFGAKRSRSFPHWRIQSLVAVASVDIAPFVPSPGHDTGYVAETVKRLKVQRTIIEGLDAQVHFYAKEKIEKPGEALEHATPEEAIKAAADYVLSKLKE